jgi:5-methylcytosine-specific restriction protein A
VTGFSKPVRDLVHARSGDWCERCGSARAVQIHHRRPRGMGGSTATDTNTASNALALCVGCHQSIESNRAEAISMGWLVPQSYSPATQVVLRRGEWVLLADDGSVLTDLRAAADNPPWM